MDKKLRRILPIIITCITVILIIVASVLIIKTITDGKNKDDSPRRPGVASVDDSVLAGIEPFEDTYDKIIRDCYSRPGSEWKEGLYTFAYVDDNEIPDLIYMVHSEGKDIGYLYMNAEDNAEMKYLSNVWFGENGYMVEAEETTGENNSKLITYYEYKYVNGEKVPLNTLQYSYNDGEEIRTSTTDGETVVIDTQEEFLRLINELVSKYRKITAGYSVDEYVNSDKTITEHVTDATPEEYEYVIQAPFVEAEAEENVSETVSVSASDNQSETTNTDTVQDWERSYLNVINNPTFERFNFIITDIDNNGTPDMILVAHSGINGPWTAICMNGQETDEFCDESGYFDYLYVNGNRLATSSFMNFYSTDSSGQEFRQSSESYGYAQYENGLIITPITYIKTTVYRGDTIISQEYYIYDKSNNFEMFPITEAEFNAVYNDIQRNYTEAEEVYSVDFRASGSNDLEGYIQVF